LKAPKTVSIVYRMKNMRNDVERYVKACKKDDLVELQRELAKGPQPKDTVFV
jgi:hypothetical protein